MQPLTVKELDAAIAATDARLSEIVWGWSLPDDDENHVRPNPGVFAQLNADITALCLMRSNAERRAKIAAIAAS